MKYKLEYLWLDGRKPIPELRGYDRHVRKRLGTAIAERFKGIELDQPIPELKIEFRIRKAD